MNNEQINNTDYYLLPCGKYLEDFIDAWGLSFALGSALKYYYRAGKKDKESKEKDMAKVDHFCRFLATKRHSCDCYFRIRVEELYNEAVNWNGLDEGRE